MIICCTTERELWWISVSSFLLCGACRASPSLSTGRWRSPHTLASYLGHHTTEVGRRGPLLSGPKLLSLTWIPNLPNGLSELIPLFSISHQKAEHYPQPQSELPHCAFRCRSLPPLIWPNFLLFPNLPNSSACHLEFVVCHSKVP